MASEPKCGKGTQTTRLSSQRHPLDGPWTLWNAASRCQISWVWPLLRLGATRPLAAEDVWPSPPSLRAREIGRRVETLWQTEQVAAAQLGRQPRLARPLWTLAGAFISRYCIFSLSCGAGFIVAPLVQREFLAGLAQGASSLELLVWGALFALCWASVALTVSLSKYNGQVGGLMCRLAAQRLIFHTCLLMHVDDVSSVVSPANLMSVDAERFFSVLNATMVHAFVLVVAFPVLLSTQLGIVPAAACMVSSLGSVALQKWIGGHVSRLRHRVMVHADQRLQLTEQFLDGIRVLKMNNWTGVAHQRLTDVRSVELHHHRRVLLLKGANLILGLASPCIVGFCMISTYALLGGRMLPEIIFPALTVLRALQIFLGNLPLAFSAFAEFSTAFERVQSFVAAYPLQAREKSPLNGVGPGTVQLEHVVLSRGGRASHPAPAPGSSRPIFKLGPVDLGLKQGDFCVVCGPVGSGKSTLLLGMLGELEPEAHGGKVLLRGRVALCGQEPWILSAALHDNVRCLRPQDPAAYQAAVSTAQLLPDIAALPAADRTEIGSRGINISGGQKARVALARAVFGSSATDIVLLDDILSAVDAHVARRIVSEVLLGALKGCTRVLVANTFLPLLLPHADRVVALAHDGSVDAIGSPKEVLSRSSWLHKAVDAMGGCNLNAASPPGQGVVEVADISLSLCGTPMSQAKAAASTKEPVDGSLLIAEQRAVGIMSGRAYAAFFKAATPAQSTAVGAAIFAAVLVLVAVAEASRTATEVWLTRWSQSEGASSNGATEPVEFWIVGYALLLLFLLAISTCRAVVFTRTVIAISSRTHSNILSKVLEASVPLFFDVVPMGRILNRFSRDLDSMDSQLPEAMSEFLQAAAYVLAIAAICVAASGYTGLVLLPLFVVFVQIRKFYGATSRELKRMEAIARSPLYVHFQETLSGLVHVRAFNLVDSMLEEFEEKVDKNVSIFFHHYSLVPWLMYRVNLLAATLVLTVVVVSVVLRESVDTALVGLGLASGAGLLGRLHQTVSFSIETENQLTSVERMEQIGCVVQEESGGCSQASVPDAWPLFGEVIFQEVQLRYRPHLPPVLDGVSFCVVGGQRAGLIGRTGSGKSSCMLALLRMVELAGGQILLDGVSVAAVPLAVLRGQAIAIIPQDPYLFCGSLRENLDPRGTSSPAACKEALERTQLEALVEDGGGLDTQVQVRGANLSLGQRQLLCIARAMLRGARVVLLDEASANIDANTDALMQNSLRSCFAGSTLLIIAHRLSTVADADVLICMDAGRVLEAGPPETLRRAGGPTAKMFADAGGQLAESRCWPSLGALRSLRR